MSTNEELSRSFPVLETERLRLRQVRREDAEAIYRYGSVPEVSRYTVFDAHRSIDDTHAFLDRVLARYERDGIGPWGIELKRSGELIGTCNFVQWDNRNRRAEIGYVLSNAYWKMGIMSEAIRRIIAFGFADMGLIRIEGRCHPDNIGSARVMEKCGMTFEGVQRKYIIVKGEVQDVKLYAITRDDSSAAASGHNGTGS